MALNEAQTERLAELCDQDDLVPLPDPDVARQVQAILWPRVPRPDTGTAAGHPAGPAAVPPTP